MKTQIKNSFYHLFVDGNANPVEVARVFLTIAAPVLVALVIYLAAKHF